MTLDEDKIFDIFLSHSHIDSPLVEELAIKLDDKANLRVWLDKWILIPGEHWQQAMARGLHLAKSCAICIGNQTPSGWFKEEIERAINRQTKDNSFRVIPILLPNAQNINVDEFLELRTWVDFKNGINDDNAFRILLSGISGVPPGRSYKREASDLFYLQICQRLERIKELRHRGLLDDDIAKEFQRNLLDRLIKI